MRDIYAREAVSQVPRILSVMDRNMPSATYGCFYRPFWHDKATDIASAHPQMCVLPLALVYKHKFPSSPYHGRRKILDWAVAGMNFWCDIQKKDGSFDEHYPNEHSFGAAAWTLYAVLESYALLKEEMNEKDRIFESITKAARFLAAGDEPGKITNHQVIAGYCLQKLYSMTGDEGLLEAAAKKFRITLDRQSGEGWFLEYDGCDLGYLTTTISFLAKTFRDTRDARLLESARKAIEFSSYFIYPNGFYGGVIGSRHTTHFHPHGYELLAGHVKEAAAVSDRTLKGLDAGYALSPAAVDQKYLPNLVIEFLLSYLDFSKKRPKAVLPCDGKPFERYFPESGLVAAKRGYYFTANVKKGGVFQVFAKRKSLVDSGVSAVDGGRIITSGWLGDCSASVQKGNMSVSGNFHEVPADYLSSKKMILSRAYLSSVGGRGSFYTKKLLINKLITNDRKHRAVFERNIRLGSDIEVVDSLRGVKDAVLNSVFATRYVPASRYFQLHELDSEDAIVRLDGSFIRREIDGRTLKVKTELK